jgi:hypothetical protein
MVWFQRSSRSLPPSYIQGEIDDVTEYIYGTTIQHNYNVGWGVMTLSSYDVFQQSRQLPGFQTSMLGQILTNETDPLFSWQYNEVSFYFDMCGSRGKGKLMSDVELSLSEWVFEGV